MLFRESQTKGRLSSFRGGTKLRTKAANLALLAAAIFLTFLALEGAVRWAFPEWAPRSALLTNFWHYDEKLGWKHVPGAIFYDLARPAHLGQLRQGAAPGQRALGALAAGKPGIPRPGALGRDPGRHQGLWRGLRSRKGRALTFHPQGGGQHPHRLQRFRARRRAPRQHDGDKHRLAVARRRQRNQKELAVEARALVTDCAEAEDRTTCVLAGMSPGLRCAYDHLSPVHQGAILAIGDLSNGVPIPAPEDWTERAVIFWGPTASSPDRRTAVNAKRPDRARSMPRRARWTRWRSPARRG